MGLELAEYLGDLKRVDRIAGWCVARNRYHDGRDSRELFDEARSAILEKIAESATGSEVTERDLFVVGKHAVNQVLYSSKKETDEAGPNAIAYWSDLNDPPQGAGFREPATDPFDERIIERLALGAVFASLSFAEQQLLLVFAAYGDLKPAAAHLGMSADRMSAKVKAARQKAFEFWFDWEPTPNVPRVTQVMTSRRGTHCGNGHEFTPENTGYRKGRGVARNRRYCMACNRARSAEVYARSREKKEEAS